MKYYEIDAQLAALYTQIEENEGELSLEQFEALKTLEMEREDKIEQFVWLFKQKKASLEHLKERKKQLETTIKARENALERFKEFIKGFAKGEKWSNGTDKIYYRNTPSVKVEEGIELPSEYTRIKIEPDLTALKEAIQEGTKIKGVEIITNNSITIQ